MKDRKFICKDCGVVIDRDLNDEDCFDSAKRIYDKDKHASPTVAFDAGINHILNNII